MLRTHPPPSIAVPQAANRSMSNTKMAMTTAVRIRLALLVRRAPGIGTRLTFIGYNMQPPIQVLFDDCPEAQSFVQLTSTSVGTGCSGSETPS